MMLMHLTTVYGRLVTSFKGLKIRGRRCDDTACIAKGVETKDMVTEHTGTACNRGGVGQLLHWRTLFATYKKRVLCLRSFKSHLLVATAYNKYVCVWSLLCLHPFVRDIQHRKWMSFGPCGVTRSPLTRN